MPNIKLKSDENIQAASILVEKGKLSSSIHCYYYSMFQLSMYILCIHHEIDYETQNKESKGIDSHKYVIFSLSGFLSKKNLFYQVDYNRYINDLKMLRKKRIIQGK